ncbi:MAG TPA: hypothetical protein VGL56_13025 [Fimbriimonadaceae bacterium]|jgi:hypothetical protein
MERPVLLFCLFLMGAVGCDSPNIVDAANKTAGNIYVSGSAKSIHDKQPSEESPKQFIGPGGRDHALWWIDNTTESVTFTISGVTRLKHTWTRDQVPSDVLVDPLGGGRAVLDVYPDHMVFRNRTQYERVVEQPPSVLLLALCCTAVPISGLIALLVRANRGRPNREVHNLLE